MPWQALAWACGHATAGFAGSHQRAFRTSSYTCSLLRWADKDYNKSHLGSEWKKPFAGASHAKGIVLEKM